MFHDNPHVCAGVKYVRFAEIIAGQGPVDMMSHVHHYSEAVSQATLAQWAHICSPYPFTTMRSIAYRNLGMEVRLLPHRFPRASQALHPKYYPLETQFVIPASSSYPSHCSAIRFAK